MLRPIIQILQRLEAYDHVELSLVLRFLEREMFHS